MTIRLEGDLIHVEGVATVEEAETLFARLQEGPRDVDLSACTGLHSAVVQALIATRARLVGAPADPFLREILIPAIAAAADPLGAGQALASKLNPYADGATALAPPPRS